LPAIKKPVWVRQEEEISKLLKKALIDKGWSVAHLAELLKVDAGNLSRIINHPMRVRFETILMVANKLGFDSLPIIR